MNKSINSKTILAQLEALTAGESNWIANLSNASALLNEHLENINWVGFYLWDQTDQQLVLGPFQGRVACIRIDSGKGVCGSSFAKKETIIVKNTDEFPGHIVCDARSQSEIVVPLIKNGQTIGVLDVDAPIKNRFDAADKELLEAFVDILMKQYSL